MATALSLKEQNTAPILVLEPFEGPLDLLLSLIEKNKIDIYDIPIDELTDQYLDYLDEMQAVDMEVASDFLLMAATLLHIKSRLLLPQKRISFDEDGVDPREDLVLKLLAYRRCKTLALELKDRYENYSACVYKPPESPLELGIKAVTGTTFVYRDLFFASARRLTQINESRFQDLSSKVSHILQREKVSLKSKMLELLKRVLKQTSIFFHDLFPSDQSSKLERVTGFLALLELLKQNKIIVKQARPFDQILIKIDPQKKSHEDLLKSIVDPQDPEDDLTAGAGAKYDAR